MSNPALEEAITVLQAEVDDLGQGTKAQPREHSAAWYLLRGRQSGLTVLKELKRRGMSDPKLCEKFVGNALKAAKCYVDESEKPVREGAA